MSNAEKIDQIIESMGKNLAEERIAEPELVEAFLADTKKNLTDHPELVPYLGRRTLGTVKSRIIGKLLTAIFGMTAIALVWLGSNWKVALGIFLFGWFMNIENIGRFVRKG